MKNSIKVKLVLFRRKLYTDVFGISYDEFEMGMYAPLPPRYRFFMRLDSFLLRIGENEKER